MLLKTFQGAGGGGGGGQPSSPPPATRTPDNLRSRDTIEILLGLSEGPIEGLVDGGKSFYVGDTPLLDEAGNMNFGSFKLTVYPGETADEIPEMQLGGATTSNNVGVQLGHNVPVTRRGQLTSGVNGIDIRLNVTALYSENNSGVYSHTVELNIEYKAASAGSYTNPFGGSITITGKTTSPYVKEIQFPVPEINEEYDIRVTQVTNPKVQDGSSSQFATVVWESFQECTNIRKNYPNTATVHLIGEATDQFASLPEFSGIYRGIKVQVPSNYDPIARTYSGAWDGTFKIAWTNNPAWLLYAYVTNTDWGLAAYNANITMDKWDVYEAGQWCDEMVGGKPRYTLNMVIAEPRSGKEMARYIAGAFNATFFDDGNGTAYLRVDKDDAAVALFAPENVADGIFEYTFSDITTQYNQVTVAFTNPDLGWQEDRRVIRDEAHIAQHGLIPLDFVAVGCTNADEAIRRGYYKLLTATTETMSVTFKTNRLGTFLRPFDVILIADEDMGYGVSGRVKSVDSSRTVVEVFEQVYLEAGVAYVAKFQVPNTDYPLNSDEPFKVIERSLINTIPGGTTTLSVNAALPENLPPHATFSLGQEGGGLGLPKPFRVMKVDEVDGDPDQVEIVAVEINRNKFAAADSGRIDGAPVYSYPKITTVEPPANLVVNPELRAYDAKFNILLHVSWDRSPSNFVRRYRVSMSRNGEPEMLVAETADTKVEIPNIVDGVYDIYVRAVNMIGLESRPLTATYSTDGIDRTPLPITGLQLEGQGNNTEFQGKDAKFVWRRTSALTSTEFGSEAADVAPPDPLFRDYVVRIYAPDGRMVREETGITDNRYVYTLEKNIEDGGPRRKFQIQVATRNTAGRISRFSKLSVSNPPPAVPAATISSLVGQIEVKYDPTGLESDVVGMLVWMSTTDGFTVAEENKVYHGGDTTILIKADPDTQFYLRYALYDSFGTTDLNLSSQYTVQSNHVVDSTPPAQPTGLTLTSFVTIAPDGTEVVKVRATWNANTEKDLSKYEWSIREDGSSWVSGLTTETSHEWVVKAGSTVDVRIRAEDTSSNRSGYTEIASIVAAADENAPGPISNLTATASFRSIFLEWTNPTDDDFSHVEVWMASVDDIEQATLHARLRTEQATITGLETGTTRYFWLRAVDWSGNAGDYTTSVSATTETAKTADFEDLSIVSAKIADAAIDDAKIASLNAAKIIAGTTLSSSVLVAGTSLGTIQGQAANPASTINAGSTQIDPGKILISGGTTLADWRSGSDATKINGGSISANSISANMLQIGSRGVVIDGIAFNAIPNTLHWTSGTISYVDDSGNAVGVSIGAGSAGWGSGTMYVYWSKGASTLTATTNRAQAMGAENIILCTYRGGSDLVANYGRTFIDGDHIKTGTIRASNLITTEALITSSAQIGTAVIQGANIANATISAAKINSVDASTITTGTLSADRISAGSITTGKLQVNGVTTDRIAGGAVTGVANSTIGGAVGMIGNYTNVNSIGFTNIAGGPVLIWYSVDCIDETIDGTASFQLRVVRSGVTIHTVHTGTIGGGTMKTFVGHFMDAPGAGAYTYQIDGLVLGGTGQIGNRVLTVMETKR